MPLLHISTDVQVPFLIVHILSLFLSNDRILIHSVSVAVKSEQLKSWHVAVVVVVVVFVLLVVFVVVGTFHLQACLF